MLRNALLKRLRDLGVATATAHYEGYGDSGEIEDPAAKDATGKEVALPAEMAEAVKDAAYEYLEQSHGGWEINEGSFGDFSIDVASGRQRLEHNERFESTEYSEVEGDLEDDEAPVEEGAQAGASEAVCTCPSLLHGHHPGCPYAAARKGA